jgi:LysM domain
VVSRQLAARKGANVFGERYIVQSGDNLWRIAAVTLGRGKEWPRIWRYNNRRDVVRITGRRIPNPDVIYVGQLLLIPRMTTIPVARDPLGYTPPGLVPAMSNAVPSNTTPQVANRTLRNDDAKLPNPNSPLSDQLSRLKIPLMFASGWASTAGHLRTSARQSLR